MLAKSDFNFISYAQFPLLGTGSPNKFFDGLAAGCISVINVKGWIEELIIKRKCGFILGSCQSNGALKSIQNISEDPDLMNAYRSNALRLAKHFDKAKLVDRIVEQIEIRF